MERTIADVEQDIQKNKTLLKNCSKGNLSSEMTVDLCQNDLQKLYFELSELKTKAGKE